MNDTVKRIIALVDEIQFFDYEMIVRPDRDGATLQARYYEPCFVTGEREAQFTRRWLISPHATKSEIVQTAFKMCLTSMEHRTWEGFTYRGKRIFGPHFNVDALHGICGQLDYRHDGKDEA